MMARASERRQARAGFTVPELMVAMLAAAVLTLTMGALLWYSTLAWKRLAVSVNLQRDMRLSMDTLSRMTRSATGMTFSGSTYTTQYSNQPPAAVTVSGSNLIYDANTSVAGTTLVLAQGTYQQFSVAVNTNVATVTLRLGTAVETVSNRVVMYRRN